MQCAQRTRVKKLEIEEKHQSSEYFFGSKGNRKLFYRVLKKGKQNKTTFIKSKEGELIENETNNVSKKIIF